MENTNKPKGKKGKKAIEKKYCNKCTNKIELLWARQKQ